MQKFALILLVVCAVFISAAPAFAKGSGDTGQTGEPPGWSQENPGNGGSDGPGEKIGPGQE